MRRRQVHHGPDGSVVLLGAIPAVATTIVTDHVKDESPTQAEEVCLPNGHKLSGSLQGQAMLHLWRRTEGNVAQRAPRCHRPRHERNGHRYRGVVQRLGRWLPTPATQVRVLPPLLGSRIAAIAPDSDSGSPGVRVPSSLPKEHALSMRILTNMEKPTMPKKVTQGLKVFGVVLGIVCVVLFVVSLFLQ